MWGDGSVKGEQNKDPLWQCFPSGVNPRSLAALGEGGGGRTYLEPHQLCAVEEGAVKPPTGPAEAGVAGLRLH